MRESIFVRMLLACALVAVCAAQAQPAVIPLSTPVEQLAREALGKQPGIAVAASWRNGQESFAGVAAGVGVAAPITSGPNATLFEIGSISKVFTGLLLAQAVEAVGKGVFEREGGKVKAVRWIARGNERRGQLTSESVPAVATLPQDQLQAFVGRYRAPKFDFVVTAENGQLAVQLTGQDRFLVYPVKGQPDRFAWDTVKAEVQFERYPSGEIHRLVLHQNGLVRAERVD